MPSLLRNISPDYKRIARELGIAGLGIFHEHLPNIVPSVNGHDLARTYFTFTNLGQASAYCIEVETIRRDGQSMDFETIDELGPGASVTCLSIVHPVVGNDPHWAFDFWTASGEAFAVPFITRCSDEKGRLIVARNVLQWDGHRAFLRAIKAARAVV